MSDDPVDVPVFAHPINVRYLEVDQQGVVFNMWYLAYFDDAMTELMAHRGLPYTEMMARGIDVQLVNSSITWRRGVRWDDDVVVRVAPSRYGTTSFTLDFAVVVRDGDGAETTHVTGRTVYVVVGTDDWTKQPVPAFLKDALGPPNPLVDA